ncbi:MAG: PQQ-binding-like beta-propeller repeat protein [Halobacterium sp.]
MSEWTRRAFVGSAGAAVVALAGCASSGSSESNGTTTSGGAATTARSTETTERTTTEETTTSAAASLDAWVTHEADASRSGSTTESVPVEGASEQWSYPAEALKTFGVAHSPLVSSAGVVVSGGSGVARLSRDGSEQFVKDYEPTGQPFVHDGTIVLVPEGTGGVLGLDVQSGSRAFLQRYQDVRSSQISAFPSSEGLVVVTNPESHVSRLQVLDWGDQSEVWAASSEADTDMKTVTYERPVVSPDGSTLYTLLEYLDYDDQVNEELTEFVAFDLASGDVRWRKNAVYRPMVATDDQVIVVAGLSSEPLASVAASDGSVRWQRSPATESFYWQYPDSRGGVCADGSTVYVAAGQTVEAVSVSDGSSQWTYSTVNEVESDPVVASNAVGFTDRQGGVVFVSTSGESLAQVNPGDVRPHSLSVAGGRFYLASGAGVHAYGGST